MQRFSLQSLLKLAVNPDNTAVGRLLMQCVADRLAFQEDILKSWRRRLDRVGQPEDKGSTGSFVGTISKSSDNNVIRTSTYHTPLWKEVSPSNQDANNEVWRTQAYPKARRKLDTIHWIHTDTQQACRHILSLSNPQQYLRHTLTEVQARHARTVETLAEMLVQDLRPHHVDLPVTQFLNQRLGIQLLCEHFVEICKGKPYGTIDYQRSVQEAVLDAVGEANILTQAYYDVIPEIGIHLATNEGNATTTTMNSSISPLATFVGPWLHYTLVELLKNAVTATVERHGATAPPPIHIYIGSDELSTWIVVEDQGTGLAPDANSASAATPSLELFRFAQTRQLWDRLDEQTTYAMVRSPLKGMGVGLSLSRRMMAYFGGALSLSNSSAGTGGARALVTLPHDLTILEASNFEQGDEEDENGDV